MRLGGSIMKPYASPKEWLAHGLGEDTPVFVEHLPDHEAYMKAAAVMRAAAERAGAPVKENCTEKRPARNKPDRPLFDAAQNRPPEQLRRDSGPCWPEM